MNTSTSPLHTPAPGGVARDADARASLHRTLSNHLGRLLEIDRRTPPQPRPRDVAPPPPLHPETVLVELKREDRQGVGLFDISGRRAAGQRAKARLPMELRRRSPDHYAGFRVQRESVLGWWARFDALDPAVVEAELLRGVTTVVPHAEVRVAQDSATEPPVLQFTIAPPEVLLGKQEPTTTGSGKLTVSKWTKTSRNDAWEQVVWSNLAACLAAGFSVCPPLSSLHAKAYTMLDGKVGCVAEVQITRGNLPGGSPAAATGAWLQGACASGAVRGSLGRKGRTGSPTFLDG